MLENDVVERAQLAPRAGARRPNCQHIGSDQHPEIDTRGIRSCAILWARASWWLAALAVGLVFGVWHVQYFGLPLLEHLAFFGAVLMLNATMIFTMVGSFWWRMLTCRLIHLCANLALTFSASAAPSMTVFVIATAAGAVVAAILVPLLDRRTKH